MLTRFLAAFLFLYCFSVGFAQENLDPIYRIKKDNLHKRAAEKKVVFFVDTLELPLIDDFSKNRIRSTSIPLPNLSVDTFQVRFRVNDEITDSFKLSFDTTYYNVYDSTTGQFNLTPHPMLTVIFYEDSNNIGNPTDTLVGWPHYETTVIDDDTSLIRFSPDAEGQNRIDSIILAFDDPFYKWTTNGAFWNNSLAIDAPTYGFITLDGIDKNGYPYDMSIPGAYGIGDILTSKPINLAYPATDSIYLSFFYQPAGYGERPNPEDSLVLEFFDPVEEKWEWQWSTAGIEFQAFEEVFVFVNDSNYLQKGFQFRFKNYTTLSGSFDLWHIDYLRLARFRKANEPIDDLAIRNPPNSYLESYTSVPWKQYKKSPNAFIKNDFILDMNNLSEAGKVFTNYYQVYDENSSLIHSSTPVLQPFDIQSPSAPAESPFKVQHFLNGAPNSFQFPIAPYQNQKKVSFAIENTTNTTPDANSDNDTIITQQVFDSYFAYDDGVSEQAYSINAAGAMLAVHFEIPNPDTLKAVLINFPQMLEDQSDRRFRIMVWKNLDEGPIYEDVLREPITTSANNFIRFPLAEEVLVNDEFYIGWIQTLQKKLYVGFDFNNNNQDEIFYSVNNGIDWFNTSFEGSLMIRPDFGFAQLDPVGIKETTAPQTREEVSFQVTPNPASQHATIKIGENQLQQFRLMDLSGRIVKSGFFYNSHSFSVDGLNPGAYFLHVINQENLKTTMKTLFIQ